MSYTERQLEILQSATKLMGERGIQNLTTKNLAADIGISEPALYRHFKNKQEILESLLWFYKERMEAGFGGIIANEHTGMEKIADLIRFQFAHFQENPATVMVIMAESSFQHSEALSRAVVEIINSKTRLMEAVLLLGQQDHSVRSDLSQAQMALLVLGTMRMTVLRWRLSHFEFDLAQTGEEIIDTLKTLLSG